MAAAVPPAATTTATIARSRIGAAYPLAYSNLPNLAYVLALTHSSSRSTGASLCTYSYLLTCSYSLALTHLPLITQFYLLALTYLLSLTCSHLLAFTHSLFTYTYPDLLTLVAGSALLPRHRPLHVVRSTQVLGQVVVGILCITWPVVLRPQRVRGGREARRAKGVQVVLRAELRCWQAALLVVPCVLRYKYG